MRHLRLFLPVLAAVLLADCQTTSTVPPTPSPSAVRATSSPTPAAAPKVLLDLHASGSATSNTFSASRDWDLIWSYDCSSIGRSSSFLVLLFPGDGELLALGSPPANEHGSRGSGFQHYHVGDGLATPDGTYYFTISSDCAWHVLAASSSGI